MDLSANTPRDRLLATIKTMNDLKHSPDVFYNSWLSSLLLGYLPPVLSKFVTNMINSKFTLVLTNVPGPDETLYVSGHSIEQIQFFVPQRGNTCLGVSIISYDGNVCISVLSDSSLGRDVHTKLVKYFEEAFDQFINMCPMNQMEANSSISGETKHENINSNV